MDGRIQTKHKQPYRYRISEILALNEGVVSQCCNYIEFQDYLRDDAGGEALKRMGVRAKFVPIRHAIPTAA